MSVPNEFRQQGLLSISEVAATMGVHRSTVWRWIREGCLRSTVPMIADPKDPSNMIPASERFRGVKPADLNRWRKIYRAAEKDPKRAEKRTRK